MDEAVRYQAEGGKEDMHMHSEGVGWSGVIGVFSGTDSGSGSGTDSGSSM